MVANPRGGVWTVIDVVFLGVAVGFAVLSWALLLLCHQLMGGER
jgi:hypothetical protein